jgi:hypothetical protein
MLAGYMQHVKVLLLMIIISVAHSVEISISYITVNVSGCEYANKEKLTYIKDAILKSGQRETYCNKYSNNPVMTVGESKLRLNPDTGQTNHDCDLSKSYFQELVIGNTGYYVSFMNSDSIRIGFYKKQNIDKISEYVIIVDGLIKEIYLKIKESG